MPYDYFLFFDIIFIFLFLCYYQYEGMDLSKNMHIHKQLTLGFLILPQCLEHPIFIATSLIILFVLSTRKSACVTGLLSKFHWNLMFKIVVYKLHFKRNREWIWNDWFRSIILYMKSFSISKFDNQFYYFRRMIN